MRANLLRLLADNRGVKGRAVKVAAQANEATVYLYDVIVADQLTAEWFGGVTPQELVPQIDGLKVDTIHLRINSPGGDVFAAQAIAAALERNPANVVAHVDGLAASAATAICMAADDVVIADGAMFMIHNAWTIAIGDKEDFIDTAALLEKVDGALAAKYSQRSGMKLEDVTQLMDAETWFTAQEAVEAGFASSVEGGTEKGDPDGDSDTDPDEDDMPMASAWNLSAFGRAPKAQASGSTDWPINGERDRAWLDSDAEARIQRWASTDGSGDKAKIDWTKFASVHFWRDPKNAEDFGGYKLAFCDVVDGQVNAIWHGVTACAEVMQGSRGGVEMPDADRAGVKRKIEAYYAKARDKFNDDTIKVPWDGGSAKAVAPAPPAANDEDAERVRLRARLVTLSGRA